MEKNFTMEEIEKTFRNYKVKRLDDGRIVGKGTHQELINLQGKYYVLHKYSDA